MTEEQREAWIEKIVESKAKNPQLLSEAAHKAWETRRRRKSEDAAAA